ncbi:MAG TPA: flippase activity-associated protein Agl23 [Pyrinomonadaceae bacterium]|nr:flippase activity-associated protein Agl23 [Pyrinomonadaceae bacterium]
MSERTWRLAGLAILVIGAFLRLYYLALVPLHHDEGVNGNFLVPLVRNGQYTYNPENYHGPTLYYFSAIIPWITRFLGGKDFLEKYGLTTFNVRFVTAAFGVATIGLALLLRSRLGTIGALCAAGLIAISPGAVYLSRYFIHESLYVFFTLGIVVAAVKYYDTGAASYLILAALSAGLMVATKETWIINGPVLLIAFLTTDLFVSLRKKQLPRLSIGLMLGLVIGPIAGALLAGVVVLFAAVFPSLIPIGGGYLLVIIAGAVTGALIGPIIGILHAFDRFGGIVPITTVMLVAFTVFIVVSVLFYSSFFRNYPKGVSDALQTLSLWRKRTHEHEHAWWQYIYWLFQEEGLILTLGGVGALIAVWRGNNRFALYIAQVAFGLLAAYSLVGYKTPWISLNFVVPLALIGGYALNTVYEKLREFQQPLFFLLPVALIVAFCGYQLYQLNFVHYDDDDYVYVYAHTRRETLVMLEQIDRVANQLGTKNETGIALLSPEYWPLPWYFRNNPRVGYYQKVVSTTEPIIIASSGQEEEIKTTFGDQYQQIDSSQLGDPRILPSRNPGGTFSLRPGVDLLLYVRRDVVQKPATQ